MDTARTVARWLLVLQGLGNIGLAAYTISRPADFAASSGPVFASASDQAIQSIGLGALGVGVYGAFFACFDDRRFFKLTAPLRFAFAAIVFTQFDDDGKMGVVAYESTVAVLATIAGYA